MKEENAQYLKSLIDGVPLQVYILLLFVFCVGTAIIIARKGKKAWRGVASLMLVEYTFLIFCSTVLFRAVRDVRDFKYRLFWSYDGLKPQMENIMNVLAFVPIGLLLGCVIKDTKWWKVLLIGVGISVSIELLQLLTKRGCSDLTDLVHNALGCLMGYGVFAMVKVSYKAIR